MRNYKKIFIGVIVLFNVILGIGLYANYQLNNRDLLSNLPEMVSTDNGTDQQPGEDGPNSNPDPDLNDSTAEHEGERNQPWWNALLSRFTGSKAGSQAAEEKPSDQEILKLAEKQLGQPVDKSDVVKVAAILVKRLESEELSFIYQMTKETKHSSQDIKKAKQILQNRLTPEELRLVQDVGLKYGKKLSFIN